MGLYEDFTIGAESAGECTLIRGDWDTFVAESALRIRPVTGQP